MKSVKFGETTLIIKNSRFICLLFPINVKEEVEKYLEEAKSKYPNATHYCYAYILDNIKKESDDGEPSGTAGIPMLQVLEKNDLNHVLCIVVRYFGKIKLGAGGLVRAYTKSVVEALKGNMVMLQRGYLIDISFGYDQLKKIDYLLKEVAILEKKFGEVITYKLYATEELIAVLKTITGLVINYQHPVYF